MVPVSKEIARQYVNSKLNINGNANSTAPYQKKNTTLACWSCFIQEKSPRDMLQHHHREHCLKFLSEEKIENFVISKGGCLFSCLSNSKYSKESS